jgi:hypothetical protein
LNGNLINDKNKYIRWQRWNDNIGMATEGEFDEWSAKQWNFNEGMATVKN